MKTLRKNLLTLALVTGFSLPLATLANPFGGAGPMGESCPMMGAGPGLMMGGQRGMGQRQQRAMMQQYHAERMELLAARLKLKPEQEALWQSFLAAQDAHREAKFRALREMRRSQEETAPAHFEGRIKFMEQNLASMKTVGKAANDLYAALDATQKQVMDKFFTECARWCSGRMGRRAMSNADQPAAPNAPAASVPADDGDED